MPSVWELLSFLGGRIFCRAILIDVLGIDYSFVQITIDDN